MRGFICMAMVAAAVVSDRLPAQTEVAPDAGGCTVSCGCSTTMCACSRTGGNGGACKADASGCTVFACVGSLLRPGTDYALAAGGAPVTVKAAARHGAAAAQVAAVRAVRWRTAARGHSLGIDCQGAVVAEYFDPRAAGRSRLRSRELTI